MASRATDALWVMVGFQAQCVIHPYNIHVPCTCCVRTSHLTRGCIYVCYVTSCVCALSWMWWDNSRLSREFGPIHANGYLFDFWFIYRYYGSASPSTAGDNVGEIFSNSVKRTCGVCQVTILSMLKQILLGNRISDNVPHRTAAHAGQ